MTCSFIALVWLESQLQHTGCIVLQPAGRGVSARVRAESSQASQVQIKASHEGFRWLRTTRLTERLFSAASHHGRGGGGIIWAHRPWRSDSVSGGGARLRLRGLTLEMWRHRPACCFWLVLASRLRLKSLKRASFSRNVFPPTCLDTSLLPFASTRGTTPWFGF